MEQHILRRAWERLSKPTHADNDDGMTYLAAIHYLIEPRGRAWLPSPVFIQRDPKQLREDAFRYIVDNSTALCDCGRRLIIPTTGRYDMMSPYTEVVVGSDLSLTEHLVVGPHGGDLSAAYFTFAVQDGQLVGKMSPYVVPQPPDYPVPPQPTFMRQHGGAYHMSRPLNVLAYELKIDGALMAKQYIGGLRFPVCLVTKIDLDNQMVTFQVSGAVRIYKNPPAKQLHNCARPLA